MMERFFALLGACLGLAIVACGGGGGGSSPAAPTPQPSVAPVITTQPQDATVAAGHTVTLSLSATGNPAPTYQWYHGDGTAISGATGSQYTTAAITKADDGAQFYAVATNAVGSATSTKATLQVQWVLIQSDPASAATQEGASVTFTVGVDAKPATCTYQWRRNGTAIPGANFESYTLDSPTVHGDDQAQFSCTVTNAAGSVTSKAAKLTVSAVPGQPVITTQPQAAVANLGDHITFSVVLDASTQTNHLTFQWYKDGAAIAGAQAAAYDLPAVAATDKGSYTCIITNDLGRAVSDAAQLLIKGNMDGFKIHNQQLLDGNNNVFLLRGVSEPHAWYTSHTQQALSDIAGKKANCVRVVLATGDRWTKTSAAEMTNIIQWCKDNKLIAILEVHDCTGYGEDAAAAPMSKAADYWISMASVLKGQENYVIINLANEPIGNSATAVATWASATSDCVVRLREAGFTHTIMIDAPFWGQDWGSEMVNSASVVWAADTLKNLVFSIHMYGVYPTYEKVDGYLSSFLATGLPLVVGEFANSDGNGVTVAASDIMERCEHYQIGYMGWSWCGNGSATLDLVNNWDPANQSAWGNLLFDGVHGIQATAKTCTVFN